MLVHRVVEARRLHYQRGPVKDPAETSTAQTPALTDGEGGAKKSKDGRHRRRIRFLGLGKKSEKDAEESTKQKSWWRWLCCR